MKKLHRALTEHLPIDSDSVHYEHTEHCQLVMLNAMPECQKEGKCKLSKITSTYPECGYIY